MEKIVIKRSRPVIFRHTRLLPRTQAVALPWHGKTYILHGRQEIEAGLKAHELTHAAQIERLGGLRYLWTHLAQRNVRYGRWRVWDREWRLGKKTALEREAYRAQREFING